MDIYHPQFKQGRSEYGELARERETVARRQERRAGRSPHVVTALDVGLGVAAIAGALWWLFR